MIQRITPDVQDVLFNTGNDTGFVKIRFSPDSDQRYVQVDFEENPNNLVFSSKDSLERVLLFVQNAKKIAKLKNTGQKIV